MIKSAMYEVFESINIGQFEQEYKKTLSAMLSGEPSLGQKYYTGLMAACDSYFCGTDNAPWDAHCVYLGLMQEVFLNVTSGKAYENRVKRFMESVTREHVARAIELLDSYMQMDDSAIEISDFEKYCESIESLPIIEFGYTYEDKENFLHKNVELEAQGFLGDILTTLYVVSCLVEEESNGVQVQEIKVSQAKMYEGNFNLPEDRYRINPDGSMSIDALLAASGVDNDYPEEEEEESVSGGILSGNSELLATLKQVEANAKQQLEWTEQQLQGKREQESIVDSKAQPQHEQGGKIRRIFSTVTALIRVKLGSGVVPLFWIAWGLFCWGSPILALLILFVLYMLGKK